ncbi:hypothetical protein F5I97DRAFT_1934930 [Phlebopus sp. FC_14]|nr:hypothetical protein F5I97DRAFT_1934930 [Phlebopus sp. FC_14]
MHIHGVIALHFLDFLINFMPSLAAYYQKPLADAWCTFQTNLINPYQHLKIFPLATNSTDEIYIQGMKDATTNFIHKQMNITAENLCKRIIVFSGNRKMFDQLLKLKKYLSMHESYFDSLCCIIPMLKLWHIKWTDLSCICRTYWGRPEDPFSLSWLAQLAQCLSPSDLKKVNFHNGSYLVNLALDAHLLNYWE